MKGFIIMKKVLIVSTIPPYPIDSGKKVVLNGIVTYFVERYGNENIDYIVLDKISNMECKPPINLVGVEQPKALTKILNVLWYSIIKKSKSIQEAMVYSKKVSKILNELTNSKNYDLILFDTLRIGQFFEKQELVKGKHILYLDDLFSLRYEKMLQTYKQYPNVHLNAIGNFGKFIPSFLRPFLKLNFIEKSLLKIEKDLIKKREVEISDKIPTNLLINKNEVKMLNQYLFNTSVREIKPYLKIEKESNRKFDGKAQFVFLGALNVPHNSISIISFIENQMNKLITRIPNVKLLIIGKHPSEKLIYLANKYRNYIEIKGYVEDIDSIFDTSCAMIVPLLFGTGVKLKTLEAFSRGLPVIGTDFAFEGIDIINGKHCILENDINKYPELMYSLLSKEKNHSLSVESQTFFFENYSKKAIYKHYKEIFG
jgi:glycosyltransferase involved in cell wall biosynthesis